jgi:hypothetical protein
MLQEDKIILEEYAWERPIDLFFIATGNPTGFAHVNRIPEPLLDRLELITMGLPEEPIEKEIMQRERFRVYDEFFRSREKTYIKEPLYVSPTSLRRRVAVPWWIIEVIAKTSRYTRDCPNIDRGASIRGSIRGLDHTYSSTEMRGGKVANLSDATSGLQLALRGRIRLRADLLGFDDREGIFTTQTSQVVEDVIWYAVRDVGKKVLTGLNIDKRELAKEIDSALSLSLTITESIKDFPIFSEALSWINDIAPVNPDYFVNSIEEQIVADLFGTEPDIAEEYRISALELLANALLTSDVVKSYSNQDRIFVPNRMES